MSKFIVSYLGGNIPSNPEESAKHFERYKEWLTSLGSSIVSAANPLKDTQTINPDGSITDGSTTAMSGFTIIEADSIQIAVEMVKSCPFLELGGSLEVSELMQMSA
jgi:hypothetical protein